MNGTPASAPASAARCTFCEVYHQFHTSTPNPAIAMSTSSMSAIHGSTKPPWSRRGAEVPRRVSSGSVTSVEGFTTLLALAQRKRFESAHGVLLDQL